VWNIESASEVGNNVEFNAMVNFQSEKIWKYRGSGEASKSWCRAPPTAPEWFDFESFVTLP